MRAAVQRGGASHQGARDLRLGVWFTSQHLVWPRTELAQWTTAHTEAGVCHLLSTASVQRQATNSVLHPRAASSGCDKPTGHPHRWTSLCRMGCPAVRRQEASAYGRPTEGGKSGRAFVDGVTDCKEAQDGREGWGCPPRAPRCWCCGRPMPVGLRTLKNWMKGQRILPGVDKPQKCKELSTRLTIKRVSLKLLNGEGPKNRHEQDFFGI